MSLPASFSKTRLLWPILLAATIFIASGRSQVAAPGIAHIDKIGHFLVFGLLATLVARCFPRRRHAWAAILVVSAYGLGDEFRQSFTPGRSVEFADWVADTLGAMLAVTLYQLWPLYRRILEWPLWGGPRKPLDSPPSPPSVKP